MEKIKNVVHNLRQQPEEQRRHLLHAVTICGGIVLFALWTLTLGKDISNPDTQARLKQDLKPLSELKNNITSGQDNTAGLIFNQNE